MDVALGFLGSIVTTIGEYTVVPIGRQFGYIIYYHRNINDLKTRVDKDLKDVRGGIQGRVDVDARNLQVILPEVQTWFTDADTITQESYQILHDDETVRNNKCFIGLCPDLKSRYQVSKMAKHNCSAVDQLVHKGNTFNCVSHPAPPPTNESIFTSKMEYFESRKKTFDEIIEALKDDQINVMGVYGMGGIGKTTLVKEVAKFAGKYHLFDEVVMAVVSQTPNTSKIQTQIAEKLGLELEDKSDLVRAGRLCERIKQVGKILIILDDVWEGLDLVAVGIPHGNAHEGCKIVLTSRDQHVCTKMKAQKKLRIDVLSETNAWTLFNKTAGNVELPNVHPIAIDIAKECAGLPIAIVTVAAALEGKDCDVWKDALLQLKNSEPRTITGMHEKVYSALQLSYNFLESAEIKYFFLLCCLFPEDSKIPPEDLMRYGMGLRLFGNRINIMDARGRVKSMVDNLKARCLLLNDENTGWRWIKMHDVVRDFAIWEASSREHVFLVRAGSKLIEWPRDETLNRYTAISLLDNLIQEFSDECDCSKLEILLLSNNDNGSVNISGVFFEGMKNLRVLSMSKMSIPAVPSSVRCLQKLRTLCLENCEISDISVIGELKDLEILSLVHSSIIELPLEVRQLIRLRLLDLSWCSHLKVIPASVIASLTRLECLYLRESFKDWAIDGQDMGKNNASLTELKHLFDLKILEIDIEIYPKSLVFGNQLIEYHISIGPKDYSPFPFVGSRVLELVGCQSIIQEGGGINMLLKKAETLKLQELEDVETVLNDFRIDGFSNLKALRLDRCGGKIKYLVDTKERMPRCVFPAVEILHLVNMVDLRQICHGHLPSTSFCELRVMSLRNLPELINLWEVPTGPARLSSLRSVDVSRCHKMECRFQFQQYVAGDLGQLRILKIDNSNNMEATLAINAEGAAAQEDEIFLYNLKELRLDNLPNLVSFFCQTNNSSSESSPHIRAHEPLFDGKVVFPALESLHLSGLHKMEKIWHEQLLLARNFNRLTKLSISNCEKLITIFPSGVGELLLNYFSVSNCDLLEDLCEGHNATSVPLPRIKNFELFGLPSLKDIWWNKVCLESLNFQNLTNLTIGGCKCQRYLFSFTASKLLIQLQYLKLEECNMMKEIIATEREEDAVVVDTIVFPKLFDLRLSQLPELTSFYQGNCTLEFHSLRTLVIKKCSKMRTFVGLSTKRSKEASEEGLEGQINQEGNSSLTIQPFFNEKVVFHDLKDLNLQRLDNLKKICNNKLPVDCFNQLDVLTVPTCNNLLVVVPSKLLPMLHNLGKLVERECDLVEEVLEQGEDSRGKLVFPNVHTLELVHLPNLKSFYLGNHNSYEEIFFIINV